MSARWTHSTEVLTRHPWSATPAAASLLVPPDLCVLTSAPPPTLVRHFCVFPGMRVASFLPQSGFTSILTTDL